MEGTRLTPELDLEGVSPDEAFAVLGNEIRLDILRVLWRAGAAHEYDDVTDTARTISFSTLRRQVDVDDNGRFNYHLSKLTPHFVRATDDGYRLSTAGKQIARTVIAVSGAESVDFTADLDETCPLCDAPMTATYEEQWLRVRCTECDGLYGDETPDGAVFFATYPAAAMRTRSQSEAFETEFYRCMLDIAYMMRGVCRECASPVAASVSVCDDHDVRDGSPCADCGTRFPVWAELWCDACGYGKYLPIEPFVMVLTPVIAFLASDGIDVLEPSFDEVVSLMQRRFETTVVDDPFRATVVVDGEPESLVVSLDDEMNVVAVDRRAT